MDVLELTRKLINIQSTTGEEGEIMAFLAEYLENMGFQVTRQTVEKDRFNILAKVGEPLAVLSTHTDTVPPLPTPFPTPAAGWLTGNPPPIKWLWVPKGP
jgi:acetylornithine deacetylase/succinyl-diaminopimelate desuccinylase-like protein